jgi:hypothetical protein
MIVGPMTVATCPMAGPTKESTEPQDWLVVLPANPTPAGVFKPQPKLPA